MTKPQVSKRHFRRGSLPLAGFVILCLILAMLGDDARGWLRYERAAVIDWQWWRIVTAHLVHLGLIHTILNLLGLGLLAWLFAAEIRPWEWLASGLLAAASIALGLFVWAPETAWYVGLSGILHGWFALGAARVHDSQPRFGLAMLCGLVVKLGWEQLSGAMPFTLALEIGPVVVDAHLFGALGGLLFYVTSRVRALAGQSGTPL